MGHTNSTANLSLPQFIGTDKPTWLGDVNGAFLAIDGYAGTNDAAVAAAASDASSALSQASAAVNTANTANTTAGNASTAANNAVGVANTANAIAGTVDAKVGLLADLNTTDRTSIVNAINEVLADTQHGIKELWVNPDVTQPIAAGTFATIMTDDTFDAFIIEYNSNILITDGLLLMNEVGATDTIQIVGLDFSSCKALRRKRVISSTVITGGYKFDCLDAEMNIIDTYAVTPATTVQENGSVIPVRILGLIHNA